MIIEKLKIDNDLEGYVSSKGDVEKFINFCIRERKDVIEKNYRVPRSVPEEAKEKRKVDSDFRLFLPADEVFNPNTPFMGKNVVITGTLDNYEDRNALAELLHAHGAAINSDVLKKTDIVIMGIGAGPKKKQKIKEFQAEGCPIRVIYEEELIAIIGEYNMTDYYSE